MFDGIGFMELLLIGVLGLVVLGPERLPVAVRSITGWIRAMKRMANSVKEELEQELKIEQLHADLKKAESKGLSNLSPELKESIEQLKQAAQSVNRPYQVQEPSKDTPAPENQIHSPVETTKAHSNPVVEASPTSVSSAASSESSQSADTASNPKANG
ncbi:Sec-independent protein translocase protein TatB [Shewanella glacialipiscicola]|uniref:Sec-independent protein translocase protein TatB n=1 Tax=Shewanella glacialipiscicola TaxID=614069 RepID=A0ABQ6J639_9GAMM|nr:Sec-independent protein translocase protein TatB [Shewanella glacialipiscicola]MCL1087876.1 Sec-independent protein translocase protein TatB [Shewanella glacialipiscicola]GIU14011.1 Sec-independent protein translocase protein TatB [Shewanella glacialipiscicola]GMA83565.1 Sec-independent protein translocase protein TatB [Shewanella glacialipiscicola]